MGDAKHEEAMRQRRTISQAQTLADLEVVGSSAVGSSERDDGVARAFQALKYSKPAQVLKVVPAQVRGPAVHHSSYKGDGAVTNAGPAVCKYLMMNISQAADQQRLDVGRPLWLLRSCSEKISSGS